MIYSQSNTSWMISSTDGQCVIGKCVDRPDDCSYFEKDVDKCAKCPEVRLSFGLWFLYYLRSLMLENTFSVNLISFPSKTTHISRCKFFVQNVFQR